MKCDGMDVFVACDSFLALRNIRNAELGTRLAARGYRVCVFVDPNQIAGARHAQVPDVEIRPLLDFNPASDTATRRWQWWMNLSRRSFKDPATYRSKLRNRLAGRRVMKYAVLPYLALGWMLGAVGLYRLFRQQAQHALRRTQPYQQYRAMFQAERPALVAGLSPEGYREMAFVQAATDAGIPTLTMIRSRDNLASKISFLPRVDAYLVWSEQQKAYMRYLYPELRGRPVHVVGSPQFSRHHDPAYRLTRAVFFETVRLDPSKPLVVFCLENPMVVPHQGNVAVALAEAFDAGRIGHGAQLLVRRHPRAFGSDDAPLGQRRFSNVAVYPPPTAVAFGEHDADLVRLVLEDEAVHLATMAYQDVNVNIMSTVIIDAALFDKPVINVAFDLPPDVPAGQSVKRFFRRTDYKVIAQTGATDEAHSLDELVELINQALDDPGRKARQRARLVEADVGLSGPRSNDALLARFMDLLQCSDESPIGKYP